MIRCGTFYIDGGFRPCIAKSGSKWAYLIYLKADKVKAKKIRNQKTGVPKPIVGKKEYPVEELARCFLKGKSCLGKRRKMNKLTENILNGILIEELK